MPSKSDASQSTRDRVRSYRERMRSRGLRPVQIWVPDNRTDAFLAEAHRQSAAVGRSEHEKADQEFIAAITDLGDA